MKFSVIVPVKDDPRVRDVVAALLPQVSEGEIVVANDGARGTVAPLPGAQIVEVNAANPGGARNAAAGRARGEILLFTDADVAIPPDWVNTALAGFSDAGVEAIQGMSRAVGSDTVARLMQEEYERFLRSHASTGLRDLCDSRCFGIRKSIFERFPFHPADIYCEDAALGRRLFEAGVSIRFLPAWEVGHLYSRSVGRELARLRRYAAGGSLYERRTGQDLFRPPGVPAAGGAGTALLRLAGARPRLGPPAARLLAGAAFVLGAGARVPGPIGRTMFTAARRAMVLSARLDPGPAPAAAGPLDAEAGPESLLRDTIRPSGK